MKALVTVAGLLALVGSASAGGVSGAGLVVLNTRADGALSMTGNSTVQVPASTVYVNSDHRSAVKTVGNATLDTPALHVVGGTSFGGGSGCTGTVTKSVTPYADPCASLAVPSHQNAPNRGSLSVSDSAPRTLSPGYYPSGLSVTGNASITFSPGTYFIAGSGLKITSGSIHGDGVTIVMMSGSLDIAGASSLTLSPPTDGDLANVVIVQPASNTSQMKLAGGSSTNIAGTIYAPKATVWLTGNSTLEGEGPQMGDLVVADQVRLTGTGAIKIGRPSLPVIALPNLPYYD